MLFSALFRRNITVLDDSDLLDLIRKDNKHAKGEIFRRYATLVMGLCLKYLKNKEQAEDLMMIIFETLPEKIAKHEIQHFKSWLFTVSRNACLMELRKKKTENASIDHALFLSPDESEAELKRTFEKEAKLNLLEEALEHLKKDQRIAVQLFYLENKSYDQVSTVMKVNLKKVKSLIQNGKRNLKLKLEQHHEF